MTATNALTSAVASMAWRPKPKSSRCSQRTPGPAVRATGTKRLDRSCGRWLGLGGLGNGRNLPLCFHAAPRSARCSNDAAPLSCSVGSQDRVVARVRRGGHVRPRLAVFRPRYHSCHCRGQRCGRCRGNYQIVPLFRARTALGRAVAGLHWQTYKRVRRAHDASEWRSMTGLLRHIDSRDRRKGARH